MDLVRSAFAALASATTALGDPRQEGIGRREAAQVIAGPGAKPERDGIEYPGPGLARGQGKPERIRSPWTVISGQRPFARPAKRQLGKAGCWPGATAPSIGEPSLSAVDAGAWRAPAGQRSPERP